MPLTTPTIPTLTDPKLEDKVLGVIATKLQTGLSWLDAAYGRAQLMVEKRGDGNYVVPGIYIGGTDGMQYMPGGLFPDAHKGNFSFFDLADRQEITWRAAAKSDFVFQAGLIVWGDFRTTYPSDWQTRSVSNVVNDVLALLSTMLTPSTSIKPIEYFYAAENIYRQQRYRADGFTHQEIDRQFLMRPYYGFRIEMEIKYLENCD